VAASKDVTGYSGRGGDWDLEYAIGAVGASQPFSGTSLQNWDHVLATYVVTNTNDSGAGSLRQAILDANANAGTDTIVFNIPVTDANHVYYRENGAAGFGAPVATTQADGAITDFDSDYVAGTARSWYRITLGTNDLVITGSVILDGTTQPGYDPAKGPIIEINAPVWPLLIPTPLRCRPATLPFGGWSSTARAMMPSRSRSTAATLSRAITLAPMFPAPRTSANVYGISVKTSNNVIGGSGLGQGNVISGNSGAADSWGIGIYNAAQATSSWATVSAPVYRHELHSQWAQRHRSVRRYRH